MASLDQALSLLRRGKLAEGTAILEELRTVSPDNVDLLYNLGMAYSEQNRLDEAIATLSRSADLRGAADDHTALGVAYGRNKQNELAIEQFRKAVELAPENSHALKNLGAMLARQEHYEEALDTLKKANEIAPTDPVILYNIGGVYEEMGELKVADGWYRKILALPGESELRNNAKDALRRLAEKSMRRVGFRPDVLHYCLAALEKFKAMAPDQVKEIAYDIALLAQRGLAINEPSKTYTLKSMPGEFTGMQLLSYMYVGFQQIDPMLDVGIDLAKEYDVAVAMYGEERRGEERRGEERRGE